MQEESETNIRGMCKNVRKTTENSFEGRFLMHRVLNIGHIVCYSSITVNEKLINEYIGGCNNELHYRRF